MIVHWGRTANFSNPAKASIASIGVLFTTGRSPILPSPGHRPGPENHDADKFRESMSVSPMDMDMGDDLILGWDWISSHDLRHL
jgi:hypothetical protein